MQNFDQTLASSTKRIDSEYFQLPVADVNTTIIFRERVYCYELYHQLRSLWSDEYWKICGEIDKKGHPILRSSTESPDILVHAPGELANFAIIEVKTADFRIKDLIKDLKTIEKFMKNSGAEYERGLCLIYGDKPNLVKKISNTVKRYIKEDGNPSNIEIWHHPCVGEQAKHIEIPGTKTVIQNF
ncbi:hypothetical protein [Photobacterium leiognathi]|uniref:hypothetical protein n=1 Tax=Photobacterium leiognathi TaxID=553611 RepID=UPI0027398F9F|nr:hypothetical protein [Photobacterium leiognathi]